MPSLTLRLPRYSGSDPAAKTYFDALSRALEQAFSNLGPQLVPPNASATIGGAAAGVTIEGTIAAPELQTSTTYANDSAAAAAGVPLGRFYRNGSVVQLRIS